jgi:polygalacturonase
MGLIKMPAKNLALATITGTRRLTSRSFGAHIQDVFNVKDYGALGDGTGAMLNTRYASLAAAQAVYPFVTDITTQTIDWAAIQQCINECGQAVGTDSQGGTVFFGARVLDAT